MQATDPSSGPPIGYGISRVETKAIQPQPPVPREHEPDLAAEIHSDVLSLCRWVHIPVGRGRGKEASQVQTVIDSGLYIDSGLLSGLEAMSQIRELLDELYGDLA